jgi:hypothetical protein
MSAKQVTAQSIVDCFIGQYYDSREAPGERQARLLKDLDALLSQARQEAREECSNDCNAYMEAKLAMAKEEIRKEARREGRLEGLKEMDEAIKYYCWSDELYSKISGLNVKRLRQEYQQPN